MAAAPRATCLPRRRLVTVSGGDGHQDLAWAYDFPTRQLQPIAGLVVFYNEKADIDVDGVWLPGARTHLFG